MYCGVISLFNILKWLYSLESIIYVCIYCCLILRKYFNLYNFTYVALWWWQDTHVSQYFQGCVNITFLHIIQFFVMWLLPTISQALFLSTVSSTKCCKQAWKRSLEGLVAASTLWHNVFGFLCCYTVALSPSKG